MTYRDMSEVTRINYLRSEIAVSNTVYEAASKIYAAFIANNQVTEENHIEMGEKAVKYALELAVTTDKVMEMSGGGM